jgi:hypothetical protein
MTTPATSQAKDQQLDTETSLDDAALDGVVGGAATAQTIKPEGDNSTAPNDGSKPDGVNGRFA